MTGESALIEGDRTWLTSLGDCLEREAHVLEERPDLLWQQVANRLAWEPSRWPALVAEEARKRRARGSLWFSLLAPPVGSTRLARSFELHHAPVSACAIDAAARTVVSGDTSGAVRIRDLGRAGATSSPTGHQGMVVDCWIDPTGRLAVTASEDGIVGVWPVAGGVTRLHDTRSEAGILGINACTVSPDGRYAVAASADSTLTAIPVDGDRPVVRLRGHTGGVNCCAVTPDGRLVVSGSQDRTLRIWDPVTGATMSVLSGHTGAVLLCDIDPAGTRVVS
ncbi:MAG: hypothetical protein R6X29_06810, partial [Acidimicrobiia bacterium]